MDELDFVHDYLMDGYQYVRAYKPLHARLVLGYAAANMRLASDERAARASYHAIQSCRALLEGRWLKHRDEIMANISMELNRIQAWKDCRRTA